MNLTEILGSRFLMSLDASGHHELDFGFVPSLMYVLSVP